MYRETNKLFTLLFAQSNAYAVTSDDKYIQVFSCEQ